jgi:RES domain-containing protein
MRVWRISKAKFADSSFSGEGAKLFDGRWNYAGVRMVYTSASLALAAIEFFVHLDPSEAPGDLVSVLATIPEDAAIERIEPEMLPGNWRRMDNNHLRQHGSNWAKAGSSLGLMGPSAVVDGEWNVLLNPSHKDFARIDLLPARTFHYDERMYKRR